MISIIRWESFSMGYCGTFHVKQCGRDRLAGQFWQGYGLDIWAGLYFFGIVVGVYGWQAWQTSKQDIQARHPSKTSKQDIGHDTRARRCTTMPNQESMSFENHYYLADFGHKNAQPDRLGDKLLASMLLAIFYFVFYILQSFHFFRFKIIQETKVWFAVCYRVTFF